MPIKNGNKPEIIGIKPELKIALNMPFELLGQIKWSICIVKPFYMYMPFDSLLFVCLFVCYAG